MRLPGCLSLTVRLCPSVPFLLAEQVVLLFLEDVLYRFREDDPERVLSSTGVSGFILR